jgi:hypothetical protein
MTSFRRFNGTLRVVSGLISPISVIGAAGLLIFALIGVRYVVRKGDGLCRRVFEDGGHVSIHVRAPLISVSLQATHQLVDREGPEVAATVVPIQSAAAE